MTRGAAKKMSDKKYISVSEYAEIKGITKQAVYKQLNNKLKPFLIVVENKKFIDLSALTEEERERFNNGLTTEEQPLNNQIQPFLESQIQEKDKIIESLLRQVENLQEQNSKLTDLLHNSQVLLAAEKKLYIEQGTAAAPDAVEVKEKKGFFGWFRKK